MSRAQSEMVVHGYFRMKAKKYRKYIPVDIVSICIMFYGFSWSWSDHYKGKDIIVDGNIISLTQKHNKYSVQTICSKHAVKYGIHGWKFKLLSATHIFIGIVLMNKLNNKRLIKYKDKQISPYCTNIIMFDVTNGGLENKITSKRKIHSYGKQCRKGDVIDMWLNLCAKTLIYDINGQSQGIASDKIKAGEYRMIVSMYSGSSLELLS